MNDLIPLIKEAFQNKQDVSFKVKGTSMRPFFVDNETEVTVTRYDGELKKLHVYLFQVEEKYLLHRYIKTKGDKHYFRGDALYNYEVVEEDNIIGEVKEMKYREYQIQCNNFRYRNSVRYYLFRKSIKILLRRIIKGK